jgi:hypothetical protein
LFLFEPLAAILRVVNARPLGWIRSGGVPADRYAVAILQTIV